MEKLNILIADKSIFYKKILSRAVEATGLGQVAQLAPDGSLALEKLRIYTIDAVMFDMLQGEPKEIEIIKTIKREYPQVIIIAMVSEKCRKSDSLQADLIREVIIKPPVEEAERSVENLKKQLQGIFTQIITDRYTSREFSGTTSKTNESMKSAHSMARKQIRKRLPENIDVVVIASSTGGPSALETIFKNIPANFEKPILVVQHMPKDLTRRLAHSLDKKSELTVIQAEDGCRITPGISLIAPGGMHMTVTPGAAQSMIKLEDSQPVNGVKPSADVLFKSMAKNWAGRSILAIILTGMGSDGMLGIKELKKSCECYCITQSERTCVVYGMPKSVADAGLSDVIEDLESIPSLMKMFSGRSHR